MFHDAPLQSPCVRQGSEIRSRWPRECAPDRELAKTGLASHLEQRHLVHRGWHMNEESPIPETARHTLALRVDRFLRGLERARRQPNRRESYHVVEALDLLREAKYADGDAAMTRAERVAPLPDAAARQFGQHEPASTAQLAATLDAIMRGEK